MSRRDIPVAIVGIGGLFPQAPTLGRFWENLRGRVSAAKEVPEGRWILSKDEAYSPAVGAADKVYSLRGCYVEDFAFDPAGFSIDPEFLLGLDPVHHFALHAGRQAWQDAVTERLDRRKVGVILGHIALPTDSSSALTRQLLGPAFEERVLKKHLPHLPAKGVEPINRYVAGLPAAVIARGLGLGGGSYCLDAACASSLYALKLAVDELKSGRADAMLTGGLSRPDSLYTQMGFSQLRALSPTGVCSPFDRKGDGLVVGEGAGVLVMKRLEDAQRDGDKVYAVIRGIGLSNDVGGSLLAPDSEGQLRAMRAAYLQAGWAPNEVEHVECHATGTPVGDAVEFQSLSTLWAHAGKGRAVLGSVKSNIGHLLTGAGAAGLIKTVMGMREGVLAPTANFAEPNPQIQLDGSPFQVLSKATCWDPKDSKTPRRAAVSAFGFGGINAHVLLEELPAPKRARQAPKPAAPAAPEARKVPVAVVGMDARFGELEGLRPFQEAVLAGKAPSAADDAVTRRWFGVENSSWFEERGYAGRSWAGRYLKDLELPAAQFRIPPKELGEMLPQQLLMLQAADAAMRDAGLARGDKPSERTGVFVGVGLDLNTNNFQFRWSLANKARAWADELGLRQGEKEEREWLKTLRDASGPPLTANRTMGALASIAASRIAREFRLGGSSFTLSSEDSSGLRALEVAVRSLQQGDLDAAVVGAVDVAGDARSVLFAHADRPYSRRGEAAPFDEGADGTVPGEGAAAVVLKRLDDALRDGDRIYAVIRGVGAASGGGIDAVTPSESAYGAALEAAYQDAGTSPASVGYIEAHGSGNPDEDRMEAAAVSRFFTQDPPGKAPVALGSAKPVIGHAGAAGGLASFVKAALALYQEILPALPLESPRRELAWATDRFHAPRAPQYWFRNRVEGPRRAGVSTFGIDGNVLHVVLEAPERVSAVRVEERAQPLGARPEALFALEEDNPPALVAALKRLRAWAEAQGDRPIEALARTWHAANRHTNTRLLGLAIVASSREDLLREVARAEKSLIEDPAHRIAEGAEPGQTGLFFSPEPLGRKGKVAFVYPGSGNQYLGMGQDLGAWWPEVLRRQDAENLFLRDQFVPWLHAPWRLSFKPGWEDEAVEHLGKDHKALIFAQVAHGVLVSDLVYTHGVKPDAVIGYSLGETAGLFAMRAWKDRDEMLRRMDTSTLFVSDLAGPCNAARKYWNLAAHEAVDWALGVIDRPRETVQDAIGKMEKVFLLIVNTPRECVVGGTRQAVWKLVEGVGGTFLPLEGVTTVHCDVAKTVAKDYRELHLLETAPPERIRFYSSAWGKAFDVTKDTAADAILAQAVDGIDFTKVVNRAYEDGVRVFLEMGPRNTCTRMVSKILGDRPHVARSACVRGQDGVGTLLGMLAQLVTERVPVDLDVLYGRPTKVAAHAEPAPKAATVSIELGRPAPKIGTPPIFPDAHSTPKNGTPSFIPAAQAPVNPALRPKRILPDEFGGAYYHEEEEKIGPAPIFEAPKQPVAAIVPSTPAVAAVQIPKATPAVAAAAPTPIPLATAPAPAVEPRKMGAGPIFQAPLLAQAIRASEATAQAHAQYLKLSAEMAQAQLAAMGLLYRGEAPVAMPPAPPVQPPVDGDGPTGPIQSVPAFPGGINEGVPFKLTREQCFEFAVGKIGNVLGKAFAHVDAYPTRVRLPDAPLQLVDRITLIEGEPNSMTSGRVVTEHDVKPGAWYLDGGRIPTCIAVEAGQADLFLSGFLGIDSQTKGLAVYRLLDAEVSFHDSLPVPGQVIRYDIRILRFVRQNDTWLFFFEFDGTVDGRPVITMRKGCAGFFTAEALAQGKGIVFTELDLRPVPGKTPADWKPLAPMAAGALSDAQVAALRQGDLAQAFGPDFAGLPLSEPVRLPGATGRMKLLDRVTKLEPEGGRYGLGLIRAEADIHPDDWFLTCHFVDDMVMPGTLMYECCMHTLRVYLMRLGWVGERAGTWVEPMPGIKSSLKCRGQVLTSTQTAAYEVSIKELGYAADGTPFVIADALMFADGKPIVLIKEMSARLKGLTRAGVEALWTRKSSQTTAGYEVRPALYGPETILAFAVGKPSEAFGEPYKPFDSERVIARLPGPPYQFLDRVTAIENSKPFEMKSGGTITAQYDIPADAWYFKANRQKSMPFAVLLEAALQPCGWYSSYMGSVLHGTEDLSYRNLGGSAVQHVEVFPDTGTLTTKVRSTNVSQSGGMIIQNFTFEMTNRGRKVYTGDTYFGFFTKKALADQVGLLGVAPYQPSPAEFARARAIDFDDGAPLTSEQIERLPDGPLDNGLALPGRALRMFDRIDCFIPDGGPKGLGYVRGVKTVVPEEWFFKAHFYQDPVWPGSLGLEAFLQLLKAAARERWGTQGLRFEPIGIGMKHEWVYRGQVTGKNKHVEITATVTAIDDKTKTITADGFLSRDGLLIYQMKGFSIRAVPA